MVDIPGHERVRNKFFDQYKKSARILVFVVDSCTVQKDVRDVAEWVAYFFSSSENSRKGL